MNQGGITDTRGSKGNRFELEQATCGSRLLNSWRGPSGSRGGGARFWVLAFALLLVNGLGWYWNGRKVQAGETPNGHTVQIEKVRPGFNVQQASEFRVLFDRPVCELDRVGQNLMDSPFTVEPELEGQWKWDGPSELVFELAKPLLPGRRFELVARPEFQELTGFELVGDSTFVRQTDSLLVQGMYVETAGKLSSTLKLKFSQAVDPADLAKQIRLTMDDQELEDWRVLEKEPAKDLSILLNYPHAFLGLTLDLRIDKELRGDGAEIGLKDDYKRGFVIPRGFTATRASAWPTSGKNTCSVSVRFNEPLALGQETPTLTFTPAVECGPAHVRGRTLELTGQFQCGQNYSVEVGEALLSASGSTLGKKQPLTFRIPERPRDVSMPDGGGLLMPGGQLQLAVQVTNVPTVEVSASRLHANNLVSYLHGNSSRETSRSVPTKRFELDLKPNEITHCSLPLTEIVDDPLGVYRVTVRDRESYWERETALVRVSDMALTVKRERRGLFVWVTSLKTGEPLDGVTLEARTHNNQVLGRAISSDQGVAHLRYPEEMPDGGAFVVSATLGRDFAYLRPDKNTWAFNKVNTAGRRHASEVDAWMYTECGVYRPGETIHLTGVLRAPDGGFAERGRYEVRLRRPDGRIDWRGELTGDAAPDGQGLFQIAMPTRAEGFTGVFTATLWDLDAEVRRQQVHVNVEEFVPTSLELGAVAQVVETERATPVEASAPRALRSNGDASPRVLNQRSSRAPMPRRRVAIDVDSKDFLGRASKGLALRVLPHWSRKTFNSEAHPEFHFTEPKKQAARRFQGRQESMSLDSQGRARVELHPGGTQLPGLWELCAAATVTETGGRSATHSIQAELDTAAYHLGFRLPGDRAPVAEPMAIDWLFVDRGGKETDGQSHTLRLEQVVREYGMETVNGRLAWTSRERHVDHGQFTIGEGAGSGTIRFQVPEAGHYRLLAQPAKGEALAEFKFYAGDGSAARVPTDPQMLELALDRDTYRPGDRVDLQVRGEFDGRLLITLEGEEVLHSQVLDFQAPIATVSLELPGDLRGGAFVCASLIRGIDARQTSWLPHRAKGLVRIRTTHRDRVLPLAVDAPERLAPGASTTIRVTSILPDLDLLSGDWLPKEARPMEASTPRPKASGRPARLHVWAVDTGVLLATAEKKPDPHAHFFAQRKRGVATADSWAQLLPDHMRADSVLRIGGDSDESEAMERRLAALPPTERKSPVAWSRALDLDADRSASVELIMPEIRGAVTLRAVLVEGDSYACHEQRIELATDLQLTATWPRYATSGDHFRVPVKVLNTTDAPMRAVLDASFDGPVSFTPDPGHTAVELDPGQEQTVWFQCQTPEAGLAQLELFASYPGGSESIRTEFQVRPATALHQEITLVQVDEGAPWKADLAANFEARGLRAKVEIAGNSRIELRPALRALIEYPHGCLEQTTSRLFALVNAGALLEQGPNGDGKLVETMVRAGIHRLHAMQTRSGGMSYWMGGTDPSAWGSAYAGSFLAEARRAGFEVPTSLSTPLMAYLAKRLRSGKEELGTQALMCRVLAAFGRPHEGWMTRVGERLHDLDMAGRAHLASAWLHLGRRDRALECLGLDTLALVCASTSNGRITSQIRQEGALLATLIDLNAQHAWVPVLAERLFQSRRNGRWRSTLEDAAALSALARYQALQPEVEDFEGTLIDGTGQRHAFDSSRSWSFEFDVEDWKGEPLAIQVEGAGRAHVMLALEGMPAVPVAAYDRNLSVRRRLFDVDGKPIAPGQTIQVGDLIQVEIDLATAGQGPNKTLPNIAIVDTLPAGLEVENPRLANSTRIVGTKSAHADRVEFREDRVVIFASAHKKAGTFRYALRATLAGEYAVPPIQASSMYDPGFASLGAGGSLRVERPAQ